jgi:DNA-directed RNA polymerase sigma subunit (sigma70/sigma32)
MEEQLSEGQRKEIFEALVDAQDHDMTVVESRQFVAKRFGVTEEDVRQIEREGLDRLWPPL